MEDEITSPSVKMNKSISFSRQFKESKKYIRLEKILDQWIKVSFNLIVNRYCNSLPERPIININETRAPDNTYLKRKISSRSTEGVQPSERVIKSPSLGLIYESI